MSARPVNGFSRDWITGSPPRTAFVTLWILASLVVTGCIWGFVAELDVVAVAQGRLITPSQLQIVQPAESGIVREILVREGQGVTTGQVLARMDPRLSDADERQLANEIAIRRLQLRRIDAELAGTLLTRRPDEPADLFAQVDQQHRARRQAHIDTLATERAVLAKAEQDLKMSIEVEAKLGRTLPIYREQESAIDQLTRDGFAGKMMLLDRRRDRIEKEQDLAAQQFTIASLKATIAQSQQRLSQLQSTYRQGLHGERVETEASLHRLRQDREKLSHRQSLLELRAPHDGVVKDLATRTVGSVVSSGTVLMTVVPSNELLQAEVWLTHLDAGQIELGQPARLKMAAYPFQRYGTLEGRVVHISPDANDLPQAANLERRRGGDEHVLPVTGYRTLIATDARDIHAQGRRFRLTPGMQVTAEIILGRRTVVDYILSPVQGALHEAGRER